VAIAGGGSPVRQVLAAGLLDELDLHVAPVVLGRAPLALDDRGRGGGATQLAS
jgi:dihydrofolate reductase